MAGTVGTPTVGPQSPLNRNLERLLEEAQISGELRIGSRRLREFPKVASKYNLNDTVYSGKCYRPFPCFSSFNTFVAACHSTGIQPKLFFTLKCSAFELLPYLYAYQSEFHQCLQIKLDAMSTASSFFCFVENTNFNWLIQSCILCMTKMKYLKLVFVFPLQIYLKTSFQNCHMKSPNLQR